MVLVIIYGSLYPFEARHPRPAEGAILFLLETWDELPSGRGDVLANILLYMPLGFFGILSISGSAHASRIIKRPLRFMTLCGVALSLTMELGQFYDAGRVTSISDLYVNGLGALLGAVLGRMTGPNVSFPFLREFEGDVFPRLLIAAWFGYRLYPYVPTIDLHKYWHALWPIIRTPDIGLNDLCRFVVSWSFIACLTERLFGWPKGLRVYAMLGGVEIAGKIFIVNNALKPADLIGLAAGCFIWPRLRARPNAAVEMAWAMAIMILAQRLLPFSLGPFHAFGWVPFGSFLHGSISVNSQSFLEKVFEYGGMLWALTAAGLSLRRAAFLLVLGLFATGLAETVLQDRSAEITDAVMALAIAFLYSAIERRAIEQRTIEKRPNFGEPTEAELSPKSQWP